MNRGAKEPRDPNWIPREKGTIELAREFVEYSKRFEKTLYAKWWTHPLLWWSREEEIWRLSDRISQISGELAERYKGVMDQLFQRMGTSSDFGNSVSKAWVSVRADVLTIRDYKGFSKTLWYAYVASVTLETQALKPKFMLRQFVDEIPSCKELGVMISMAYGPRTIPPPLGSEVLHCLSSAYSLLHEALQRYSSDLHVMTDGEISSVIIANIAPPFVQYEDWMFNC